MICGDVFEPLTPRHFSFNHSEGACPECGGLGRKLTFSDELIVPDPEKSVREGAIKPWRIGGKNLIIRHNALLKQLAEQLPFDRRGAVEETCRRRRATRSCYGAGERLFSFQAAPHARRPKSKPFPA